MNIELLRQSQLEILLHIKKICEKLNIQWFLAYGTLLGAVRHKGFIPWDRDVDIMLLRDDYEKLITYLISQNNKQNRFYLWHYSLGKGQISPHAIIFDNTYILERNDIPSKYLQKHLKKFGPYVDIFVIDNAPDERKLQIKHGRKLRRLIHLLYYKRNEQFSNNYFYKIKKTLLSVLLAPLPFKFLSYKLDKTMSNYRQYKTKNVVDGADISSYDRTLFPRRIFEEITYLDFEGYKFPAPKEFDYYLKQVYGDYFVLPSQEYIDSQYTLMPICKKNLL